MTRTALVTGGGGRGIGRAIARRLLADGWSLVTFDRVRPDDLHARERFIEVDLADAGATAEALARATDGAEITGLVNNVGIVEPASLEQTTFESLAAVVNINLRCTIQCAQALLPAMERARHGRIVNISSRAALGKELRTAYAATKAGLHGVTRTWALELAPRGITVNAVAPGPIDTELFRQVNPPDDPRTARIVAGIPVQRMGTPDDIAHAVAFFMDERSSFITGQVMYVCGGITVGLYGTG
ncbi:MAG TPA: SDR family oxidoreductase [Pelomicrobium sp.]|nr:SDR family oxidoreductase [Pelomicrobium sp.]